MHTLVTARRDVRECGQLLALPRQGLRDATVAVRACVRKLALSLGRGEKTWQRNETALLCKEEIDEAESISSLGSAIEDHWQ